ncbi:MAG: glutaminase A [Cyanophyceae cyanobacterium]
MTDTDVRQTPVSLKVLSEELVSFIEDLHHRTLPLKEGAVADYIPELAQANPDCFGISLMTADGQGLNVGDTNILFTIQSLSKPFVYGLALEDWGEEAVLDKIGVEPTGDAFNEIIELEEIQDRQYNPMVNAGAIATTSLIKGATPAERQCRLMGLFQRYLGRSVAVDQAVFWSRKRGDNLNRAIAYMLLSSGLVAGNIEETLDLYFRQCSVSVTCQDLAVMAATLANAGVNPVTNRRVLDERYVKNLVSVMYTCGLYDFSGQWAYRVGLPAKSGLAGAIVAVVPGIAGIAVYSPPLGEHKKSLRGVRVLEELSQRFGLHVFEQSQGQHSLWRVARNGQGKAKGNNGGGDHLRPSSPADRDPRQQSDPIVAPISEALASVSPESALAQLNTTPQELTVFLEQLYEQYLPLRNGKIYVSEPNLVEISPDWFALCAVTVDGQVCAVGDWEQPFLIQSISKVFAYGLALEDCGREDVLTKVAVEPTGDAYNSIIKVEENSKRPFNPMVNTGAIAITSLIAGRSPAHRLNRVLEMYRRYVGHRVYVDTTAVVSETNQGDRNWAIAYLLRNFGMISGDIKQTLDLYLQQCSALIDCRDLAVMGATLANGGTNPMTQERALDGEYVRDLLSVMFTCGMYDFAGEWAYKVGFPAKSGVGGGIIAVVPGLMGIAVYSPLLDKRGNSVRGIKVCQELSHRFKLHIFEPMGRE